MTLLIELIASSEEHQTEKQVSVGEESLQLGTKSKPLVLIVRANHNQLLFVMNICICIWVEMSGNTHSGSRKNKQSSRPSSSTASKTSPKNPKKSFNSIN